MKDIISDGLKVITNIAALAGNVFNSAIHLINSPSISSLTSSPSTRSTSTSSPSPSPSPSPSYIGIPRKAAAAVAAAMHVPNPHDYDPTGDMSANETHHTLHSSGAAPIGGPNKVLFLLTLIVGLWMVSQMVTPVSGGIIRRQGEREEKETGTSTETETMTETDEGGGFTYYQLNGDGTTETPVVQGEEPPASSVHTDDEDDGRQGRTTVFPSSHDGTVHNHVSIVTEPETTAYITDVVIETDVVTITVSDLEATDGGEGGFQTSVVTHTGTWYHTHLPNEEAHTVSWTHQHTVTTTDSHFDPVTTIDEVDWTEHTKTHEHMGGPTEYLPEHTRHHTFTIPTTYTSTITSDTSVIYTEWVGATAATL
ncbi:hypothetical protein TWF506_004004 [Arthrobotrys conoides]|uniref:Uncharacterized protein n=1 Tax=Arthrobotrys conoides TaxID=74498 RepID=A0AAN8N3H7_9PEZI